MLSQANLKFSDPSTAAFISAPKGVLGYNGRTNLSRIDDEKSKQIKQEISFVPNIENFKTSLMYEGIKLKSSVEGQTVESLKRKYAR